MTDKTKKLFDAPWELFSDPDEEIFQIETKSGNFVAEVMMFDDAKRLVLLPELYDALVEAAYEHCHTCVDLSSESGYVPNSSEFIENGCPKKSETCFCVKWWKLLKKVRGDDATM